MPRRRDAKPDIYRVIADIKKEQRNARQSQMPLGFSWVVENGELFIKNNKTNTLTKVS